MCTNSLPCFRFIGCQLRRNSVTDNEIFLIRRTCLILEDYLVTNSFDAVREAFRRVHPTYQVPNKKLMFRLAEKFREKGNVGERKHVTSMTIRTHDT